MEALYSTYIPTKEGNKKIAVYAADITFFDQQIDILTASAYQRSYYPTPKTLFEALEKVHIRIRSLAQHPEIDLRNLCNVWLSSPLSNTESGITRIGCIEMIHQVYKAGDSIGRMVDEREMFRSIKAYFQMLDIASNYNIKMDTVAIPVLGSGEQHISADLTLVPLINECVEFLKRNSAVKRIFFIERNMEKALQVKRVLESSYAISSDQEMLRNAAEPEHAQKPVAFISYSSNDKNVADNLCAKLESKGIQVWYAPRDVQGDYASSITQAIAKATHFVVILSKSSMNSQHVLNEIDLAFKKLPNNIKFCPLRIDEQEFAPAFEYYLSRQHWLEAYIPPLEQRLIEFVHYFMEQL